MLTLREHLADLTWRLYAWLTPIPPGERLPLPMRREGRFCQFLADGTVMSEPRYRIVSQRGNFDMGRIEWSPQWRAYSFVSAGSPTDLVRWNGQALAEVYALLRALGQSTGRFV